MYSKIKSFLNFFSKNKCKKQESIIFSEKQNKEIENDETILYKIDFNNIALNLSLASQLPDQCSLHRLSHQTEMGIYIYS